jgi:predicted nucleic acid-binding protein
MIAETHSPGRRLVFLESSAALALILREPSTASTVDAILEQAQRLFIASIAVVECHRVILRARSRGVLSALEAEAAEHRLQRLLGHVDIIELESSVMARAVAPMGDDLIRTVDAIEVASAAVARDIVGALDFLSFDDRVRLVAQHLGFSVVPPVLPSN